MKMTDVGIVTPMNNEELKTLTQITRETIATDALTASGLQKFGLIDLWKLRKANKTTTSLRRHF